GASRHPGRRACLWREAPARDRARARLLAEPAAARRAARRHEPAGAGRDRQAAQVDQPRPHHGDHRSRHGLAVRAGGARHGAAGGPRARRRHAERDQGQRQGAGSLSGRSARRMSLLEVTGLNSYYGDSHILFDVGLRVEQNEVVALLGRNGAGKSTTLKSLMGLVKPHSGAVKLAGERIDQLQPNAIAKRGMQLVPEDRRIFGSLNVEENLILAAFTAASPWPLGRIYET